MNWPAPATKPSSFPPPATERIDDPFTSSTTPRQPSEIGRLLRSIPPAAWVALVGGALVLIAAAVVVAGNWESIGQPLRAVGLVVVTSVLMLIAERYRTSLPTTAGVVAHLAAFLTAPVGITIASAFGQTWPACLVVGGVLAALVTEVQARRWQATTLHTGQVAAISLAATGLAALTDTSAGMIAGLAAIGLLLAGSKLRAASLAIAAVLSPAVVALADAGIGAGTFERAGLVGERLGWSGPVTGILAAVVLAAVARDRRSGGLMLAAVAAPLLGVISGLAAIDAPNVAWWSIPALALIAAELGWWLAPDERIRGTLAPITDAAAAVVALGALFSPAIVSVGLWLESGPDHPWAVPAGVTAFALALVALRWSQADHRLVDLAVAASLITAVAAVIAFEAPELVIAVCAVAATIAAAIFSRRLSPVAIYPTALWAFFAVGAIDPASEGAAIDLAGAAVLLAVLTGGLLMARARLAADRLPIGWVELGGIVGVGGLAAATFIDDHNGALFAVAIAIASLVAVLIERRLATWSVVIIGFGSLLATMGASTNDGALQIDPWMSAGWMAGALALAGIWAYTRDRIVIHAAAAASVVGVLTATGATTLDADRLIGLWIVFVGVLTGLAFTTQRRTPLDAAAITAGTLLAVISTAAESPGWMSAAWTAVGLQVLAYGFATRRHELRLVGASVSGSAGASWWFTSGLHERLVDWLAPHGVIEGDLWMLVAASAALAAGVVTRRRLEVSSWIAYSGSLAIAGLWLVSVQIDRETLWAVPAALTVGLVAVALGGWRRLAAPLVGGIVVTGTTLVLAAGEDLQQLPTWVWLATGGLALLGVAFAIERTGLRVIDDLKSVAERWD